MFLKVNDLDLHVRQSGPPGAPALLLLHSLGTQAPVWDEPAEQLARSWRVIQPDLRGHGLTTVTPGPYRIEGLAGDMLALLDALGIAACHVAGLSVGGMIAQALAAAAPARVSSLILVDTAPCLPPAQTWLDRAALVRAQGLEPLMDTVPVRWVTAAALQAPRTQGLRAMLRQSPPEGYAATAEAIAAADLRQSNRGLRLPTLVLVGDQDSSTPPSTAEALRDAIAGAKLDIIEGAAHLPTMEQPQAVAAAMAAFLAGLAEPAQQAPQQDGAR